MLCSPTIGLSFNHQQLHIRHSSTTMRFTRSKTKRDPKELQRQEEINRLIATHETKQLWSDQEIHKAQEEKSRLTAMSWLRSHFPAGLLGSKEEVQETFGMGMGTEVDMQVYASDGTPVWPRRRPIPFTVSGPESGDSLMDEWYGT